MIVLGVVLAVLGFVFGIEVLWILGIVLIIVGAILWIVGARHPVGGRRHWY